MSGFVGVIGERGDAKSSARVGGVKQRSVNRQVPIALKETNQVGPLLYFWTKNMTGVFDHHGLVALQYLVVKLFKRGGRCFQTQAIPGPKWIVLELVLDVRGEYGVVESVESECDGEVLKEKENKEQE